MVPAQPADLHSMPPMQCMDQSRNMNMTLIGKPLLAFSSQPSIVACLNSLATCQGSTATAQVSLTCMAIAMARGMQAMASTCRRQACLSWPHGLCSWQAMGIPTGLLASLVACKNGVKRAHLVDARVDGGLILELYSRDGVGTMISSDFYEVYLCRPMVYLIYGTYTQTAPVAPPLLLQRHLKCDISHHAPPMPEAARQNDYRASHMKPSLQPVSRPCRRLADPEADRPGIKAEIAGGCIVSAALSVLMRACMR